MRRRSLRALLRRLRRRRTRNVPSLPSWLEPGWRTTAILLAAVSLAAAGDARAYSSLSGPNDTGRVVLSYDDCPDSYSLYANVLRWASNNGVGLVLAPTGDCVRSFKSSRGVDIAALARRRGHYVINHSRSHRDLTTLSDARIRREVAGGVRSPYVRPPYGAHNSRVRRVLRSMGRKMWLWNVDTRDWEGRSQAQVVHHVVRRSGRGDTVLMHFRWNGFSTFAVRQMVSGLSRRNIGTCRPYGLASTGRVRTSPAWLPTRLPC